MAKSAITELLRLKVSHKYFGDGPVPVRFAPDKPSEFRRDHLVLKQEIDGCSVWLGADGRRPNGVRLILVPVEETILRVTAGLNPPKAPRFKLALTSGRQKVRFSDLEAASLDQRAKHVAAFDIGLPNDCDAQLTLAFDTFDTFWTYHISGFERFGQLSVMDKLGQIEFEQIAGDTVTGGRNVRSFRSKSVLQMKSSPVHQFELIEQNTGGSTSLIRKLPAAGSDIRRDVVTDALHSDIYITL